MNNNCLLVDSNCNGNCAHCGWNPEEAERREKAIAENGLTVCEDGLKRLNIKQEE